jgi:recombination protein RecA
MAKKPVKEPDGIDKSVGGDVRSVLSALQKDFKKKYTTGIPAFGDEVDLSIQLYSSGILALDSALTGGLPVGRITEFYGEQQSGKSLIAMLTVAETQRKGGQCVWFDVEQALNPDWAAQLGVDVDNLIICPNVVVEEIFDMIKSYASTGKVALIVLDSVAAMMSKAESEADMDNRIYSPVAGALSRVLKQVNPVLSSSNTSLLLINQVREDMNSMYPGFVTPGGMALKHFASTRVHIKKPPASKQLKVEDQVEGLDIDVKVVKHRGGANFQEAHFRLWYKYGIDRDYDLMQTLLSYGGRGGMTQSGPSYILGDKKWFGQNALIEDIRSKPELRQELVNIVTKLIRTGGIKDGEGDKGSSTAGVQLHPEGNPEV